jgi:hypothetical protein
MMTRRSLFAAIAAFFARPALPASTNITNLTKDDIVSGTLAATTEPCPATIMLDILKRIGFEDGELDLPSFERAKCYIGAGDFLAANAAEAELYDLCKGTGTVIVFANEKLRIEKAPYYGAGSIQTLKVDDEHPQKNYVVYNKALNLTQQRIHREHN